MKIIEVDTRTFLAHYIPTQNRIEVSKYLKNYEKLYKTVLKHEKAHSELEPFSFRHIWLDIKDRAKFFSDRELLREWHDFREPLKPKTLKGKFFMLIYGLSSIIQIFEMLLVIPTFFRGSDKWKRFKGWLSEFWETWLSSGF